LTIGQKLGTHDFRLQQLSTRTRDLRKFGLVSAAFILLGGWFLFRNKPAGPYFLTPSVVLVLFGFVAARALEIVYIAWMSLAFTMGLLRNHTFTGKDIEKPY